ncbi:hypothetical protein ACIBF5_15865 [Micromonospora sp. NPDC050417]|uniref:hypothetical protein n=1 Tax=Micromonospora sp. NPDC050417 TaxID=3364280 RepID=UPI0037AA1DF1
MNSTRRKWFADPNDQAPAAASPPASEPAPVERVDIRPALMLVGAATIGAPRRTGSAPTRRGNRGWWR